MIEPTETVTSATSAGPPFPSSVTSGPRMITRGTELSMSLSGSSASGTAPWIRGSAVKTVSSTGMVGASSPAGPLRGNGPFVLLRPADLVDAEPDRRQCRDQHEGDDRRDEALAANDGGERAGRRDRRDDPADVLVDAQQLRPRQRAGEDSFPQQRVTEADDQAAARGGAEREEDRGVDERPDRDRDGKRHRDRAAAARPAAQQCTGQDRRRHQQDRREAARDEQLRDDDRPARNGLGEDVDRGAVVELAAQRGGSEDEGDERQDGRHEQAVERGDERAAARAAATEPDEQREEDRRASQQQHQERAAAADE